MTPEEFRRAGHAMVDWIADYRATLAQQPVMARAKPGEIKAMLPPSPPDHRAAMADILADFD